MASAGHSPDSVEPYAAAVCPVRGGHIRLIMGPMFSGKSTELLRVINIYKVAKRSCVLLKHSHDVRYDNDSRVCTHDMRTMGAMNVTELMDASHAVKDFDIIGIDEGQFFNDLPEFCDAMARAGKIVIVASLAGTFKRRPWPCVSALIPLCEKIVLTSAICSECCRDAAFTHRRDGAADDLSTANSDSAILVGGKESYLALCRSCHFREANK